MVEGAADTVSLIVSPHILIWPLYIRYIGQDCHWTVYSYFETCEYLRFINRVSRTEIFLRLISGKSRFASWLSLIHSNILTNMSSGEIYTALSVREAISHKPAIGVYFNETEVIKNDWNNAVKEYVTLDKYSATWRDRVLFARFCCESSLLLKPHLASRKKQREK